MNLIVRLCQEIRRIAEPGEQPEKEGCDAGVVLIAEERACLRVKVLKCKRCCIRCAVLNRA